MYGSKSIYLGNCSANQWVKFLSIELSASNYRCIEFTCIIPYGWGINNIVNIRVGTDLSNPIIRYQAWGINKETSINSSGKFYIGFKRTNEILEVFFLTYNTLANSSITILSYTSDYTHQWAKTTLVAEPTTYITSDMDIIRDIYNYYEPDFIFRRTINSDLKMAEHTFSFMMMTSGNTSKRIKFTRQDSSNGSFVFFMIGRYQSYFVVITQVSNRFDSINKKLMMDQMNDDYEIEYSDEYQSIEIYQKDTGLHSYDVLLLYGYASLTPPNFTVYIPESE